MEPNASSWIRRIPPRVRVPATPRRGVGTKKRQDRDIAMAHDRWVDYKKRKAEEK